MSELQMVQQMCHPTTLVSGCRTHHRLLNLVIDGNHAGTGCAVGETGGRKSYPQVFSFSHTEQFRSTSPRLHLAKQQIWFRGKTNATSGRFPPNAGSHVNNRGVIHTHKHTLTLCDEVCFSKKNYFLNISSTISALTSHKHPPPNNRNSQ